MTMLASEPARCRKCGNEQYYTKVISWNTWLDLEYPANNKCYKCGAEIRYDDIDMSKCSPQHRGEVRFNKIYERLSLKEKNDGNNQNHVCPKCGSNKLSYGSTCGIKLPNKYKSKDNYFIIKDFYDCNDCGYRMYKTIDEILYDGLYEFVENGENEHEYIVKYVDNYQEIIDESRRQFEENLVQVENELISEGLITTKEEEQEYEDKYYERWRN